MRQRNNDQGFAIISVMSILGVLAALSWSVIAPSTLQQRAALSSECHLKATNAAQQMIHQAKASISDGTATCDVINTNGMLADYNCDSAPACYRIECFSSYKKITAISHGCARRKAVIQLGVLEKAGAIDFRWWKSSL